MKSRLGQKLYLRIWLAIVGAVAVLTLVVGWLWQMALDHDRQERDARMARELVVRNAAGEVVGKSPARAVRVPGQGLEFQVEMNDGQTLYMQLPRPNRPPGTPVPARRNDSWWSLSPFGFVGMISLVGLAVALGAYPIVRRLTKRLEGLQKGVERWGQGDLSTRLPVQGQDEVAFLAERFNASAERVQSLLLAHKTLLANASHELRSPLARIRMGLELLGRDPGTASARAEIARNIEELDQLVDEILLASRLDLRDAHDAGALGEMIGAELGRQIRRGPGRARVVPEQGRPDDPSARVERDEPVLLTGDRDGLDVVQSAGENWPNTRRVFPRTPRICLSPRHVYPYRT